ncbi:MAG: DUF5678 domain-containing protein [Chloroflexota bacterium]|nr:DUF5678 domain-containing protein [Chloroflexota bacterium]MDE2884663.1 DUF5678 domain-containing protein [Chloroflexota bacterium]
MPEQSLTTTTRDPELALDRLDLDMHHLRFCADSEYFNSIWPDVRRKYPDKYVALFRREVVASNAKLERVLEELRDQDLPANHIVIRFVSRNPRRMIL